MDSRASDADAIRLPNSIQVTQPVYETLKHEFAFEARGKIEVTKAAPRPGS
jgi:hypothetical protein